MEHKTNNFRQFDVPDTGKKKSRFLAILFGFCPGAGQMYLGKMNRGLTLMALFFGDIALGVIFPPMLFILPLIWFYAFFDTLNLSGLNAAQLEQVADELGASVLDQLNFSRLKKHIQGKNGGRLAGWALIVVGAYMLYEMLAYKITDLLEWLFGRSIYWLTNLVSEVPQLLISVLIIWLGIRLIRGSRRPSDEMTAYGSKPYPRANVTSGAAAAGSVPDPAYQPQPSPFEQPIAGANYQSQPSPFEQPIAGTNYQAQPSPFEQPIAGANYQPQPSPFEQSAAGANYQPQPSPFEQPIAGTNYQPQSSPFEQPAAGTNYQPQPSPADSSPDPFANTPDIDITASVMGRIHAEQTAGETGQAAEPQSPLTTDPFGSSAKNSLEGMGIPKNAAEEAQAWKNL